MNKMGKKIFQIRLLAMDLDGTVLTNDKRISERTMQAFADAWQAGILPVFVTGRPVKGLPDGLQEVSGFRYVISSNGAVVTDMQTGEKLYTAGLPASAAQEIAAIPEARSLAYSVIIDGIGYSGACAFQKVTDYFRGTPIEAYIRDTRRSVPDIGARIRQAAPDSIENIWIMAESRKERNEIGRYVRENYPVHTVYTAERDVEIVSPQADKGLALTFLAGRLGIREEQIAAFGDNENDIGMLAAAGVRVAMGNALDPVKEQATIIADTNERDGVAKIIEEILGG